MDTLHPREQNFHPAKCSTIFNRLNIWEQAPGANWANLSLVCTDTFKMSLEHAPGGKPLVCIGLTCVRGNLFSCEKKDWKYSGILRTNLMTSSSWPVSSVGKSAAPVSHRPGFESRQAWTFSGFLFVTTCVASLVAMVFFAPHKACTLFQAFRSGGSDGGELAKN